MADLLTHVLVGYIIGRLLSLRYDGLTAAHVTLAMIGAATPDLLRIDLLFPEEYVEWQLGVPFSWDPLHTLLGSLLVCGLIAMLVAPDYRKHVIVMLAMGVVSHHVLDILLIEVTGQSYAVFWPFTEIRPPSGNLYRSTDRWPAVVSGLCALFLGMFGWWRDRSRDPRAVD